MVWYRNAIRAHDLIGPRDLWCHVERAVVAKSNWLEKPGADEKVSQ